MGYKEGWEETQSETTVFELNRAIKGVRDLVAGNQYDSKKYNPNFACKEDGEIFDVFISTRSFFQMGEGSTQKVISLSWISFKTQEHIFVTL